ncbi:hypothetical protein GCM10027443_07080 [Pontibacter brevis]
MDACFKANGGDHATAIAVDNAGGVYVTGSSNGTDFAPDYATVRYNATSGEQTWVQRYSGDVFDVAQAIAVDNTGGIYVTGASYSQSTSFDFATVRYAATTREQTWVERYSSGGSATAVAVDTALDTRGNIIITGYTYDYNEGADFLTIKYSQCPAFTAAGITGSGTAAVGTARSVYTLPGTGANSFTWSITDSEGMPYTNFTGQGTGSVAVNWPSEPDVFKVTVTYGGGAGCPTQTAVMYVHVFDVEAGFVTGGGWIQSPANPAYEFMQQGGTVHWSFMAKYMKGAENRVMGATQLLLENGSLAFKGTTVLDRSLVITGNTAYFRGLGTLTYRDNTGRFVTDPRRFGYSVAATDGQHLNGNQPDELRIIIWEINQDGTQGPVVYDNQVACLSSSLYENLEPCSAIGQGAIVIHTPNTRSVSRKSVMAAEGAPVHPGLEAYPTAFHDRTTIAFAVEQNATPYTLDLYDLKGTLVQRIASGTAETERQYEHELLVRNLAKGLYLARLTTGSRVQTVKLVVQR